LTQYFYYSLAVRVNASHQPLVKEPFSERFILTDAFEKLLNALGRVQEIISIDEGSCRLGANWPTSDCSITKPKANDLQIVTRVKAPGCRSLFEFGIIGVEADDIVTLPTETDPLIRVVRPVVIV